MSSTFCIVVANSVHARFFTTDSSTDTLREGQSLMHAEVRELEQELVSDRPGSSPNVGFGSHSIAGENTAKQHQVQLFAREITHVLEHGLQERQFFHIYLLAPAKMIGLIRKTLSPKLQAALKGEFDSNLVKADTTQIRRHLPQYL